MNRNTIKTTLIGIISSTTLFSANSAWAFDGDNYSLSIFGTAGYAISDRDFSYNRINQHGTFDADSKLGVQLDYQFNDKFSATVQAKFAAATDKDNRWRPELSWAFLSYRPTNDWLLRLGKLRIPSLLYTENMDVGMSYNSLRLPLEVYKTSPIYDFWGISGSKNFELENGNSLVVDAYAGYAQFMSRYWVNDDLPGIINRGAQHTALRAKATGVIVSWNSDDLQNSLRFGVHYAAARKRYNGDLWLKEPHKVNTQYGYYYDINSRFPGYGEKDLQILFWILGLKWNLGNEFSLKAEAVRRQALGMKHGYDSNSFFVNLSRPIGKFTPYITFSWIKSDSDILRAINDMNVRQTGVAAQYNAINHVAADALQASDQYSLMLGTSYNISPHQRLKFEYMRTHVGKYSTYMDPASKEPLRDTNVNTFSMSYNFLF